MVNFKNYKYIGMPFHAVGFPQPVYSHLMGTNDGVNWDDLKSYSFGWRDASMAYINGEYWICTGTYVNRTTDFENFAQINCPKMGLKNLWASEFFQANDGQWWFVYCGSETDVDYSEYKLYASKIYPDTYTIDSTRYDIQLNSSGGYIDPNLNYINGNYYLWSSRTDTPTQELRLFRSTSILGPYTEVSTNIMTLVNQNGYTWDEAPEMLVQDGKYYLYSDPWNHGDDESKRDVYRCESTDLTNWYNMQRCNADCTMRHFTPLYIGSFSNIEKPSDNNVPDNNTPDNNVPDNNTPDNNASDNNNSVDNASFSTKLWDGNVGTLETINQANFTSIQKLLDTIAQLSETNPLFNDYGTNFDLQILNLCNRNARVQFLSNANKLDKILPELMDDTLVVSGNVDYTYKKPVIPTILYFDKDVWNNYWQTIADDLNLVVDAINKIIGGTN